MKKFCMAAVAFVAVFLVPAVAFAHAHPVKMNPAKDATVASPAVLEITFSEDLEAKQCVLNVRDSKGTKVNTASSQPVAGDAKTLTLALPVLRPGLYTVQWKSVAVDLHTLTGSYTFTVK